MEKTTAKPTAAAAASEPEVHEFEQGIDEYCAQLSGTDGRVELIGAFNSVAKAAGHTTALPSVFAERFEAFTKAPA